jgi:hypothetical protein
MQLRCRTKSSFIQAGFMLDAVCCQSREDLRGLNMTEKIKSETISRRKALSLLGLGALSLAVPGTLLTVSDAEAQQTAPAPAPSSPARQTAPAPAPSSPAPQTGTERRQERRTSRVKRRKARRKGRKDRRALRRSGEKKN